MAQIPRPNVATPIVSGSVGRQRIDAPREAFGSGEGIARLGQGIANIGGAVEQRAAMAKEAADKERQKSRQIAYRKSMVGLKNELNSWYSFNKDNPDRQAVMNEYAELQTSLKDKWGQNVDPEDYEMFSLEADEWNMSMFNGLEQRNAAMWDAENKAQIYASIDTEAKALVSDAWMMASVSDWEGFEFLRGTEQFENSLSRIDEVAVGEVGDKAKRAVRNDARAQVIQAAIEDQININRENYELSADNLKNVVATAGLEPETAKKLNANIDMMKKKVAKEITQAIDAQADAVYTGYENSILSAADSGDYSLAASIYESASGNKASLASSDDPYGAKKLKLLDKLHKNIRKPPNAENYLEVTKALYEGGPQKAKARLDEFMLDDKISTSDYKGLSTSIMSYEQKAYDTEMKGIIDSWKAMAKADSLYKINAEGYVVDPLSGEVLLPERILKVQPGSAPEGMLSLYDRFANVDVNQVTEKQFVTELLPKLEELRNRPNMTTQTFKLEAGYLLQPYRKIIDQQNLRRNQIKEW